MNAVVESRAPLRAWGRGLLAGPGALITACLIMAGGALWIPPGRANVDNLVFPIVLFPLLWTALFLYAFLEKKLWRAWAIMGCLSGANAVLLTIHFLR